MRALLSVFILLFFIGVFLFILDESENAGDFQLKLNQTSPIILEGQTSLSLKGVFNPPRLRRRLRASVNNTPWPITWTDMKNGQMEMVLPAMKPGIHNVQFDASFMGNRRRTVAIPLVVGPFAKDDIWSEQAISLFISSQFLTGFGKEIEKTLDEVILNKIPEKYKNLITSISTKSLSLKVANQGIEVSGLVVLNSHSDFSVHGLLAFYVDDEHQLNLSTQNFEVTIKLRGDLSKALEQVAAEKGANIGKDIGSFLGEPGQFVGSIVGSLLAGKAAQYLARDYLSNRIKKIIINDVVPYIQDVLTVNKPLTILGKTGITLRWSRATMMIPGQGIKAWFDITPSSKPPGLKKIVPGAPLTGEPAADLQFNAPVGICVSADGVNMLLYNAWAHGQLDEALFEKQFIKKINKQISMLTVSLSKAKFAMPLSFKGDGTLASFIDINLMDGKKEITASLFASSDIDVRWTNSEAKLKLMPKNLALGCHDNEILDACYPDLMVIANKNSDLIKGINIDLSANIKKLTQLKLFERSKKNINLKLDPQNISIEKGNLTATFIPRYK